MTLRRWVDREGSVLMNGRTGGGGGIRNYLTVGLLYSQSLSCVHLSCHVSFNFNSTKLESLWRRETQLGKCPLQIGPFLVDGVGGPSSPGTGPAEQAIESKSVSSASPLASASVPASRRLPFDSLGGWTVMERPK